MTLQNGLDYLIRKFKDAGLAEPQYEARQLVQEALGITLSQLLSHPDRDLEIAHSEKIQQWAAERARGVPLAYLSGHKGFYRYDFAVEPGVLVPRPESELVVETAIRRAEGLPKIHNIVDMGCGSGCIGLSLILEISSAYLWAVDSSLKACELTRKNAQQLGVESRLRVENKRVEDWSTPEHFEIIVANPPYIAKNDPRVERAVREHEPHEALFGGEDGLEFLRRWSKWAHQMLNKNGVFVCEFGSDQGEQMKKILTNFGFVDLQIEKDLAGLDRVISGVRP